ncbi:unannotated protein [freshwater metagenome]|uniref:Unannotated protein n=1 Tax=freshwater metagenome TaxID=449393 RepID=A0A6J7VYV5_9ZZZZ
MVGSKLFAETLPSAPLALTERRVVVVPLVTKMSEALLVSLRTRLLAEDSNTVQRVESTKVVSTPHACPKPESPTAEFPVAKSVALAGVAAATGNWELVPSTTPVPTNADKANSESFFMCVSSVRSAVRQCGLVEAAVRRA